MIYKVTFLGKTGRYEAETEQDAADKCIARRFRGSDGLHINETHIDGNTVRVLCGFAGHIGQPVTIYGHVKTRQSRGGWSLDNSVVLNVEAAR